MITAAELIARGLAHQRGGRTAQARLIYSHVLEREPMQPDALALLGAIELEAGSPARALPMLRRAVAVQPARVDGHVGAARALRQAGGGDAAIRWLRRSLALRAGDSALAFELAQWLLPRDALAALKLFNHALLLDPDAPGPLCGIAAAFDALGDSGKAERPLRMAQALAPQHAPAWLVAGLMARGQGRLGAALRDLARAAVLQPRSLEALDSLVWCCQLAGEVEWAASGARRLRGGAPDRADLHASLILALQPLAAASQAEILCECRDWNRRFASSLADEAPPHVNDADPDRRLRVGYVAAQGFRMHTAGALLLPLIEGHDPDAVELFCYSDVPQEREDRVTDLLRARVPNWRRSGGLSDADLAGQIRADRIDVLVDIHGYPPGSRLLALARRPAPVQVNGVPMSSFGLDAVGWAVADERLTPPGSEAWFTERLARVPLSYCHHPLVEAPPFVRRVRTGPIVFGSLNQPGKIPRTTLAVWGRILREVPDSRLVLKAMGFADAAVSARYRRRALDMGVPAERLELRPWSPTAQAHLETYDEIDIALDPFPYCGMTTTCEALSRGVPVVSLAADRVIGRYGASLLGAIGLEHLVASSVDRYVEIALELAAKPSELAVLREELQRRFPGSPICDGISYARSLEDAYRMMWRDWCQGR